MSKVDHPRHYNEGKIEVIDIIEDWDLGFHDGNVIKYVLRAKFKGNEIQDLEKAVWYLKRYIKLRKEAHDREAEEQDAIWSPCGGNYLAGPSKFGD